MSWSKLKLIGFFSVAAIIPVFAIFAADQAVHKSQLELFFEKEGVPAVATLANGINGISGNNNDDNTENGLGFFTIGTLLIPDSRSLQRNNVNCENPRFLIALNSGVLTKKFDGNSINRSVNGVPSFLGHASKTGEAEMISWNPIDRRYEFSIVTDYIPGKKPRVARANRSTCTACHQNEGPIFSHFPWSETSFNPSIQEMIQNCQKNKNNTIPQTMNNAFIFDDAVRRGNRAVQAARVCRDLCGNNLACRKALLVKTLRHAPNPNPSAINSFVTQIDSKSNAVLAKFWPKDGFRYPSSVLPDRDPLENADSQGSTKLFIDSNDQRIFFPETDLLENPTYDERQATSANPTLQNSKNSGDSFTAQPTSLLLSIKGIRSLADPRTPRPLVSALRTKIDNNTDLFGLLSGVCFGWDNGEIVSLKKIWIQLLMN